MVPGETQTSTSPTASGITSGTPCGGGDGPSSTVLGSSGHESTDSNTASVVSTTSGTHVVHGCNTVTAERQNVKQSKKKTRETELIKRQIAEWGLKKPSSARNKVWHQAFKYDKCPKGTPNGWEHHAICKVCLGENVGNAVVKLGCSDSPQALVSHFLQHHKEEWENMHKEKHRSIAFTSRDSTGKSTRPSPLRTPTAEQHSLVDETRKSVKRLFDSIAGPAGSSTAAQTGESSSISGEGLSSSGKCAAGSDMRTYFHAQSARGGPDAKWVDKLVELIVEEYLPLTFCEKPAFREMVFLLNEKAVCPAAKGIKRRMQEMRVTIQEELKPLLRDEWMGRLVMENTGIAHYGCADHRLEKTALKFYSHPAIAESLSRAQTIVSFLHKSSQLSDKVRAACSVTSIVYKTVASDVKTRWWSTYMMCEGMLHLKEALNAPFSFPASEAGKENGAFLLHRGPCGTV